MKDTATITWVTYQNFGTYLQAYALQQYIMSLGYANHIIDDGGIVDSRRPHIKWIVKKIGLRLVRKSFRAYERSEKSRNRLFLDFKRKYLLMDYDTSNMVSLGLRYETYICGVIKFGILFH